MLYVSCQPNQNELYYTRDFILNMAYAAELGGAQGLRIEGIKNINFVKKRCSLPLIGLIKIKIPNKERYITPSLKEVDKLIKTDCDLIAIDYTLRDGMDENFYFKISDHLRKISKKKIVADISTIEEAKMASKLEVDYIATTLRGYTKKTKQIEVPDIDFIKELKDSGINNIIAEGGYSNHSQFKKAVENGAIIVTVGTAITRPHLIVKKILTGEYNP
ncbi:MAG: putative N-acetylmannosamine-6-phosphate 2-epimerase [Promethearchaeota archaeon]